MSLKEKAKGLAAGVTAAGLFASGATVAASATHTEAPARGDTTGTAQNAGTATFSEGTLSLQRPIVVEGVKAASRSASSARTGSDSSDEGIAAQAKANVVAQQSADAALEKKWWPDADLSSLNPELRGVLVEAQKRDLAAGGGGFVVAEVERNAAQQAEKVAQGYSTSSFGDSAHNFGKGSGLTQAVDIYPVGSDGKIDLSDSPENLARYNRIINTVKQVSQEHVDKGLIRDPNGITSGADWTDGFVDRPHLQVGRSPTNAEVAAGANPKEWKNNLIPGGEAGEQQFQQEYTGKLEALEKGKLTQEAQSQSQSQAETQAQSQQPSSPPSQSFKALGEGVSQSLKNVLNETGFKAPEGVKTNNAQSSAASPPATPNAQTRSRGSAMTPR